jgi:hypothetical protein
MDSGNSGYGPVAKCYKRGEEEPSGSAEDREFQEGLCLSFLLHSASVERMVYRHFYDNLSSVYLYEQSVCFLCVNLVCVNLLFNMYISPPNNYSGFLILRYRTCTALRIYCYTWVRWIYLLLFSFINNPADDGKNVHGCLVGCSNAETGVCLPTFQVL